MRVVLAVAMLLFLPAAARADYTVATVEKPTPVSAYAGHIVWSQWDGSAYRLYEAHASTTGQVTTQLAAAPRGVPFDADIGPGADGAPTVVYSRCATEPRLRADQLPIWATGRGCDVYELPLGATAEARVAGVSTGDASEFLPSIWRGRIAFGRVYEQRAGTRGVYPYVYVRGDGPSERQPGGMRGETGLPGPTSLDLAGVRLALTWGATVNGDSRTDARLDTTTGGHTLLEFTTGQGPRRARRQRVRVRRPRVVGARDRHRSPSSLPSLADRDREARGGRHPRRPPTDAEHRSAVGDEPLLVAARPRRR